MYNICLDLIFSSVVSRSRFGYYCCWYSCIYCDFASHFCQIGGSSCISRGLLLYCVSHLVVFFRLLCSIVDADSSSNFKCFHYIYATYRVLFIWLFHSLSQRFYGFDLWVLRFFLCILVPKWQTWKRISFKRLVWWSQWQQKYTHKKLLKWSWCINRAYDFRKKNLKYHGICKQFTAETSIHRKMQLKLKFWSSNR